MQYALKHMHTTIQTHTTIPIESTAQKKKKKNCSIKENVRMEIQTEKWDKIHTKASNEQVGIMSCLMGLNLMSNLKNHLIFGWKGT